MAAAIREAVARHLRSSPDAARAGVPADWAPLLPVEIGEVEVEVDGRMRIGAWRLDLDGDRARLDYHPPGAASARHRAWFRIELTRVGDAWEIAPPGVRFVRAWARDR